VGIKCVLSKIYALVEKRMPIFKSHPNADDLFILF
jgi:hypothetical protein